MSSYDGHILSLGSGTAIGLLTYWMWSAVTVALTIIAMLAAQRAQHLSKRARFWSHPGLATLRLKKKQNLQRLFMMEKKGHECEGETVLPLCEAGACHEGMSAGPDAFNLRCASNQIMG